MLISNSEYFHCNLSKNGSRHEQISKETEEVSTATPIPFLENIVHSFLNISHIESFDSDEQKKTDILKSFNVLEDYYKNTSDNLDIDFHHNFLIPRLIDFFVFFNDNTEITVHCLHCFCYICQKAYGNLITELIKSDFFLKRLIQTMSCPDDGIRTPSQFTFSQLIKEKNFRGEKKITFWFELAKDIENKEYLSTVYYELSKDNRISLSLKNDIIFFSLQMINLAENAVAVRNSIKTVIICVKNETNPSFLTQVQTDFRQFQHIILQLFDGVQFISVLYKLFDIFMKKGIINFDYLFNNKIFDRMLNVHLECSDDKALCKILIFFSNLAKIYQFELEIIYNISKEFVLKCIGVAFDSSFNVRKAAVMLVCDLIEIELIDVRYCFNQDFTFFRILVDLIMIPANDIIESLLECFMTLTTLSDSFLNFIVKPNFFNEQERLHCALEEIADSFAENERIADLVEDIIYAIKKELPKDQNELYGKDFDE